MNDINLHFATSNPPSPLLVAVTYCVTKVYPPFTPETQSLLNHINNRHSA